MNKAFTKVVLTASLMTPLIALAFCNVPMYSNNQQLNQMAEANYNQCMQNESFQQQQQQQYQQQQQRVDQQSQQMQQSIDNQSYINQQRNRQLDQELNQRFGQY